MRLLCEASETAKCEALFYARLKTVTPLPERIDALLLEKKTVQSTRKKTPQRVLARQSPGGTHAHTPLQSTQTENFH